MLNITIHHRGDVAIFHCAGEITAGSYTPLKNAVLAQERPHLMVLDLAGVTALDAAGLGALVELRASVKAAGKQLKLMNLIPRLEALLRLTRLNGVFDVCSRAEALNLTCQPFDPSCGIPALIEVRA